LPPLPTYLPRKGRIGKHGKEKKSPTVAIFSALGGMGFWRWEMGDVRGRRGMWCGGRTVTWKERERDRGTESGRGRGGGGADTAAFFLPA
jgi:hypothetical protein